MRGRLSSAAMLALLMTAALAAPALAGKPTREVIDIGTPADEAIWGAYMSTLCGFTITASIESTVTVHVFTDRDGEFKREIDKYLSWDTFTNPATGASVTLHDLGPDLFWINRDGELMQAIVGRSLTGSGYIGRFVINLDSGEVVHISGRYVGTFEDQICEPLQP
jgi:hypothetical protein